MKKTHMLSKKLPIAITIVLFNTFLLPSPGIACTKESVTAQNTIGYIRTINSVSYSETASINNPSEHIPPLAKKEVFNSLLYGNTAGNIGSGGLVAMQNGWVYYHSADDGGTLYKAKIDGTLREKLCDDLSYSINVMDDYVFYTNLEDNSSIYRIKTDGTERIKLCDDTASSIAVIDNYVYYINSSDKESLYRMDLYGSQKHKINNHSTKYLNVKHDWIYYINPSDNCSIYRIKVDDPSVVQKLQNVYARGINVTDKYIFFSNQKDRGSLYRINLDGTDMVKLCIDVPFDLQAVNDWLYYSDASDSDKLYKIKTDGTGKTPLYANSAYLLNIAGDYVYFSSEREGLKLCRIKIDGTSFEEVGSSLVHDYIESTRKILTEKENFQEGKVEWVDAQKLASETDGIPVKDAFKSDGSKIAFLTFDDGPSRNVTPAILDILKKYNIKATFFVTGSMATNNGDIIKRIYSEGHTIGNHSYSHRYSYLYSSLQNFMGEVKKCENVLKNILGEEFETKIFRFPGGSFGNNHSQYKAALSKNGYEYINWNVSTGDSQYNGVPVSRLMANLKDASYGKDRIVVLMHDLGTKQTTVQALPGIIEYLKSQGYEFKKLIR